MIQRDYFSGQEKNGIDRLPEDTDRQFYGTYEQVKRREALANKGPVDELGGFGRLNRGFGRFQAPHARKLN